MKKITKSKMVLNHLKSGKSITSLEAINLYSATRLSAIIFNLRKRGHTIATLPKIIIDKYGNKCEFAQYRLINDDTISAFEEDLFTHSGEYVPPSTASYYKAETKGTYNKNFLQKLWSKIISEEK